LKSNALWAISNIFGENNLELTRQTLNKTCYMDFLIQFTQKQHTFDLLEQAAWSLDNILRLIKNLSYEEVTKLVILLYF